MIPVKFFCPFTGKRRDRKSTRLNSSHVRISYAVFCLKKVKGAGGGSAMRRGAGGSMPAGTPAAVRCWANAAVQSNDAKVMAVRVLRFFFRKTGAPPKSTPFPYRKLLPL